MENTAPSAGDLANLVPDAGTILAGIGSVAVVMISISLAILGYRKIRVMLGR